MTPIAQGSVGDLLARLRVLEEMQLATLNILEDFDMEKRRLEDVQRATVNILEDFNLERERSDLSQRASLNILEDFDDEKRRLEELQRATVNILADFESEQQRMGLTQRASLNILEDFDAERTRLETMQRATINILDDFSAEKSLLEQNQRALLNILDDFDIERAKVALANQQLESANKELEAFSYSVSHDLSAPLRSLDGFSQALLEDYAGTLDAQAADYLRRIRAASQRMGQLIDDMLNLSRITRSSMQLAKVDLSAIVQAIAMELQERDPVRRVEFVVQPGVAVIGDARLLRIALDNLVGNAWKFTAKKPTARIEFGETILDGRSVYFVRDDGAGFNMAYANKLFGAFQRLHTASEFAGTGIGLATVQRVVRRHGGRIWAEGQEGRGASFYFTLGG